MSVQNFGDTAPFSREPWQSLTTKILYPGMNSIVDAIPEPNPRNFHSLRANLLPRNCRFNSFFSPNVSLGEEKACTLNGGPVSG